MRGWFMSGLKALLLALLVMAGPVWAEVDLKGVEAISAKEFDKVGAILGQQQRNFGETCTSLKLLKATALIVGVPVTMDVAGKPVTGNWRVRYAVDACGKVGMRMVDFTPMNGGIALEALVPGDSLTDARLQGDVVKSFRMAGQLMMPNCVDQPVVRETKVRIFPKTANDRWQEFWTGRMCGRDIGQVVEFMPTKHGTTFKMGLPVQTVKPMTITK